MLNRRSLSVANYWFGRNNCDGAIELDRPHLNAFPGGHYHMTVLSIAIELMAEDILRC